MRSAFQPVTAALTPPSISHALALPPPPPTISATTFPPSWRYAVFWSPEVVVFFHWTVGRALRGPRPSWSTKTRASAWGTSAPSPVESGEAAWSKLPPVFLSIRLGWALNDAHRVGLSLPGSGTRAEPQHSSHASAVLRCGDWSLHILQRLPQSAARRRNSCFASRETMRAAATAISKDPGRQGRTDERGAPSVDFHSALECLAEELWSSDQWVDQFVRDGTGARVPHTEAFVPTPPGQP